MIPIVTELGHIGVSSVSPDGCKLAYSYSERVNPYESRLYILNLISKEKKLLVERGFNCWPCFSPDGARIAFARAQEIRARSTGGWAPTGFDVYVVDVETKRETRLTRKGFALHGFDGPWFSSNGENVIFKTASNTWLINIESNVLKLKESFSRDDEDMWSISPSWSGKRMVYTKYTGNIGGRRCYDIFVSNIDGNCELRVTNKGSMSYAPKLSSNEEKIVFLLAANENDRGYRGFSEFSVCEIDTTGKNFRIVLTPDLISATACK